MRSKHHLRKFTASGTLIALLVLAAGATVSALPPVDRGTRPPSSGGSASTRNIDPCLFAPEGQLRSLVSIGLGAAFPIKHSKKGKHVTIKAPRLIDLNCPGLKVSVRARLRYKKTRGVPRFSTSGKLRFGSDLVARPSLRSGAAEPVRAADVRQALACMTDLKVTRLDLKRVPNWLDNTWVRKRLDEKLGGKMCVNITSYVRRFLQQGGSLGGTSAAVTRPDPRVLGKARIQPHEPQGTRRSTLNPRDLGPGHAFKAMARSLAAVKGAVRQMRAKIKVHYADDCCQHHIRAMRREAAALSDAVSTLRARYKKARHKQGMKLSARMATEVTRLRQSIASLTKAGGSAAAARRSLNKISRAVASLEQLVLKIDDCCQLASTASTRAPAMRAPAGSSTAPGSLSAAPAKRVDLVFDHHNAAWSCKEKQEGNCYACPRVVSPIRVKNAGYLAVTKPFWVTVYYKQALVGNWQVNGLGPGEGRTVGEVEYFPWNCEGAQRMSTAKNTRYVIDEQNRIEEFREDNNEIRRWFWDDEEPVFRPR